MFTDSNQLFCILDLKKIYVSHNTINILKPLKSHIPLSFKLYIFNVLKVFGLCYYIHVYTHRTCNFYVYDTVLTLWIIM